MKRKISILLAFAMLFSLCGCGGSASDGSAATETIALKLSQHDSSSSVIGLFLHDWADAVTNASNGTLEVTVYDGAVLTAPADGINALNNGVCDILWTCLGFFPSQFPYSEAATMPFNGLTNAVQGAYVMNEAWESIPEVRAEWEAKGLKPLIFYTAPASYLLSTCRIAEPADFAGTTIRSMSGIPTKLLEEMGSTSVVTPSGDIFTSMQKDIIQGTIFDMGGAKGFKLYEVTNYVLATPLFEQVIVLLMTQERYDSLPQEAKDAIDEYSGLTGALEHAQRYEEDSAEYLAEFEAADRIVYPTEEQNAAFQEVGDSVISYYIEEYEKEYPNYSNVVEQFQELIDQYAQDED